MTSKITIAAADARVGDLIYNGPGAHTHPTFAWETVTKVDQVDGLMLLTIGRLDHANGDFWFEPDEEVVVIRHPPVVEEVVIPKSHHRHGHGHSG